MQFLKGVFGMKKTMMFYFFSCTLLILVACNNETSSTMFKGEGEKWIGEITASYDDGVEKQSLEIHYKGDRLEDIQVKTVEVSNDFFGWKVYDIQLDEEGNYYGKEEFETENKTPSSSKIYLVIEGVESETILLSYDPQD